MRPASPLRGQDRPGGLRPGQLVEAVIEKGVYRGRGLGRVDGRVVFVPRAHPGDRVRARLTEVHAGWAEGALVEVLAAAPARRASPCPYVPRCGGCSYQDLGYEAQLRVKESVLRESLRRAGAPWEGPVAVHASPESGWRMRASLHFSTGENGLELGLQQEGTRRVVDVRACLQLSERMNRAARALRDALAESPALGPRLRGLDLLESPDGGTLLASLETVARPPRGARARLPRGARAGARRLRGRDGAPAPVAARGAVRRGERPRRRPAGPRAVVLPGEPLPARAPGAHGRGPGAGGGRAGRRPLRGGRPLRAAARRPRRAGRARGGVGVVGRRRRPVGRAPQRARGGARRGGRRRQGPRRGGPGDGGAHRARPAANGRGARGGGSRRRPRAGGDRVRLVRPADARARPRGPGQRGAIGRTWFTSSTSSPTRSTWRRSSACAAPERRL